MSANAINSCKCYDLNPKFALEDITCYKIFRKENNEYYGPFTDYKFNYVFPGTIIKPEKSSCDMNWFEKIFPALLNKRKFIPYVSRGITYDFENGYYNITSGFIHSFPYDVSGHLKDYVWDYGEFELWECVIPKGTIFFQANARASHFEAWGTYASKCIKLIKKVDAI